MNKIPKFFNDLPIGQKLMLMSFVIIAPFVIVLALFIFQINRLTTSYDSIVKNITGANEYNIVFKEEVDSVMYQMVARSLDKEEVEEELSMRNPDALISEAESSFRAMSANTESREAGNRINSILNLLSTLRKRAGEINDTVKISGHYDENMMRLDTDIRIITELIQERISEYIYYESESMEKTRREIDEQRKILINVSILTIFLIAFATIVLSLLISSSITKPIDELCHVTDEVAHGNFGIRSDIRSGGELVQLGNSLNEMSEQLGTLVDNIRKEQINSRNLELRLLQAQINPHFLYNTLDNIVWLAQDDQKEQVASIVTSLSTFFRTTLSGGRDSVRIRDEISHIKAYLEIQQFRYSDIMDYRIDAPEEFSNYSIIKMTLQPVVENALYHGLKNKRGGGLIEISIRERTLEIPKNPDIFKGVGDEVKGELMANGTEDSLQEELLSNGPLSVGQDPESEILRQLVLTVKDDGIGMSEEELFRLTRIAELKEKPTIEGSGFGIANVAERLRLNYGEDCGIRFTSRMGEGTTVEIVIPEIPYV
ncbi:MAG: sensor histidine kinase [Lachnospiraceae bacterium]|nr:sensor histidine kinase [Lachnospiraceae bacterium]